MAEQREKRPEGQKSQGMQGREGWKESCHLCPRDCGVARGDGEIGVCKTTARIQVARASLHLWEEPCIAGEGGSGTVFFAGCSLGCVYCQNQEISRAAVGRTLSIRQLSWIFLLLKEKGAENINLVTPSHYAPAIQEAVELARKEGLELPVIYNCSGYESVEVLKRLEGIVDVYLTDFKYMDQELARRYSRAGDYPRVAKAALEEMVRQQGQAVFDSRGMMKKGVILRHLLLPGAVKNGKEILHYAFEHYGNGIYYSLLNQYTPMEHREDYPELNRRVTRREYEALVDTALELGVEHGFIQEGKTAEESFIPDFADRGLLDGIPEDGEAFCRCG